MAGAKFGVGGVEGGAGLLGKRDLGGVVRGEVVAKFPDAGEEWSVG